MKAQWNCCVCGKVFERYGSQVCNPERPCCSQACYGKRQSIDNTGERNANYKNGEWSKHSRCACGALKDPRSIRCAKCAGRSKPRSSVTKRRNNDRLRRTILLAELIPYVCAKCKLGNEWQDKPITLQLDHINGDNIDDRLENLRFLCPNCHSQTPTWGYRNAKR